MTTLSRGKYPDPCLDRLLLLFWATYMEESPTEFHRTPTTEVHPTKMASSRASWDEETKRVTENGETKKELTFERNGRIPSKWAKWNRGKQTIRHRIQKNAYKDAQWTLWKLEENEWELQQHKKGNRNYKQEPEIDEEYNIWNLKKIHVKGLQAC